MPSGGRDAGLTRLLQPVCSINNFFKSLTLMVNTTNRVPDNNRVTITHNVRLLYRLPCLIWKRKQKVKKLLKNVENPRLSPKELAPKQELMSLKNKIWFSKLAAGWMFVKKMLPRLRIWTEWIYSYSTFNLLLRTSPSLPDRVLNECEG